MIKSTIILLLMFLLAACTLPEDSRLGYKRLLLNGAPQGDDSFSQGWRDGCDTALAIVGVGTMRLVPERLNYVTVDRMTNDPQYDQGFNIGSGYCTNFLDFNSG